MNTLGDTLRTLRDLTARASAIKTLTDTVRAEATALLAADANAKGTTPTERLDDGTTIALRPASPWSPVITNEEEVAATLLEHDHTNDVIAVITIPGHHLTDAVNKLNATGHVIDAYLALTPTARDIIKAGTTITAVDEHATTRTSDTAEQVPANHVEATYTTHIDHTTGEATTITLPGIAARRTLPGITVRLAPATRNAATATERA